MDPCPADYFVKQTNFDLEWPGKSIYTKDHPLHEQSLADMPAQKAAAAAEIEASNLQTVAQRAARDAGEARARGDRDAAAKEAIAARAERDAASSNAAAQVVAKAAAETAVGETQQRLAAEQRFKGLFDFASCSAQKAKLLLSIMESPKESGGAGINFEEFGPEGSEILSDFFPLHGESELQLLRHRWAKWSLMFHDSFGSRKQLLDIDGSPMHDPSTNPPKPLLEVLPCRWNQPLDEIRDYFGVKIAFCELTHSDLTAVPSIFTEIHSLKFLQILPSWESTQLSSPLVVQWDSRCTVTFSSATSQQINHRSENIFTIHQCID
eukprot:SAG11_NODE_1180_length_5595_cov_5.933224_4_plen_323_part_00